MIPPWATLLESLKDTFQLAPLALQASWEEASLELPSQWHPLAKAVDEHDIAPFLRIFLLQTPKQYQKHLNVQFYLCCLKKWMLVLQEVHEGFRLLNN